MTDHDDAFGDDEEADDDFDRLTHALFEHISQFADDEDVPDELLSQLLLRISLTTRMMAYGTSVAKPSGGGLKLDLDRFPREADDLIRHAKKEADHTVAEMREAIEAAAEEDEDKDET